MNAPTLTASKTEVEEGQERTIMRRSVIHFGKLAGRGHVSFDSIVRILGMLIKVSR